MRTHQEPGHPRGTRQTAIARASPEGTRGHGVLTRRDRGEHQGPESQQRDVVGTPKRGVSSPGIGEVTKTTGLHHEGHRDDTWRPGTSPGGTRGDTKTCGLSRRCGAEGGMGGGHQNHRAPPGGTPRDPSGWTWGGHQDQRTPPGGTRGTTNAPPGGTGGTPKPVASAGDVGQKEGWGRTPKPQSPTRRDTQGPIRMDMGRTPGPEDPTRRDTRDNQCSTRRDRRDTQGPIRRDTVAPGRTWGGHQAYKAPPQGTHEPPPGGI